MKKLIMSAVLMFVCCIAFATPKPSQIEDALAAKDFASAKQMIAEVLRDKPESARAHLMNAYVLVKADHNKVAANEEIKNAMSLDKDGSVKNSALFGRTVAEIDLQKATPVAVKGQAVAVIADTPKRPHIDAVDVIVTFAWICLFIALVAFAFRQYYKAKLEALKLQQERERLSLEAERIAWREKILADARERELKLKYPQSDSLAGTNFVDNILPSSPNSFPANPAFYPPGQGYPVAPQHVVTHVHNQPMTGGMGFGGQLAATAGGVVVGEALSHAMFDKRDSGSHSNRQHDVNGPAYVSPAIEPDPTPSPVSYATERTSFSSGSSDSWSSSSSSSSSDSWGSSDFGSDSSSW